MLFRTVRFVSAVVCMKNFGAMAGRFLPAALLIGGQLFIMAQNETTSRWLEKAGPVPKVKIPEKRITWQQDRSKMRTELVRLLGKLPPRPAHPEVITLYREDRGEYWLEKFQFDNEAGANVPGYLFIPKNRTGKVPAILYCHWHGGEYDIGKEEMLQARHTPEPPGPALARRGYVVLGIDAYCFGERNGQGPGGPVEKGAAGELSATKFNLWFGRTLWGMILRDDLMALDYLATRPEVDPEQIGVTGISMGATRTWWLMALDERLKAGVAVACLTRYQDLIEDAAMNQHGIYYYVPDVLTHFDTEGIVSLIAPRAVLFLTGDRDKGSPVSGIHKIEETVRQAYALYGAPVNFESVIFPNTGHEYLPEMWTRMFQWMDRNLKTTR